MEKPIKFKINTTLTYSVNSYAWPSHAPSSQAVEKAVKTVACSCRLMSPQHFSFSQTYTCVSIKQLDFELEISITHRSQEWII